MEELELWEIDFVADRAMQSGLSQEEQLRYANMPYFEVREALAFNPTISRETFLLLESDLTLQEPLLANPSCPEEVLERLAIFGHYDPSNHPNATGVVRGFAETEDHGAVGVPTYDPVVDWVEKGHRTVEQALWRSHNEYRRLYLDYDADTARVEDEFLLEWWALSLPFTPAHVLDRIADKYEPRLMNRRRLESPAMDSPEVIAAEAASNDVGEVTKVLAQLALHPNASKQLLAKLADTKHVSIGKKVALNANTTLPTLKRLARAGDIELDIALAQHPSANVAKLFDTLAARTVKVRTRLARNSKLPAWRLDELADTTSIHVLAALAANQNYAPNDPHRFWGHTHELVRQRAATNSALSTDALLVLSADPDPRVRGAVAANPSTPEQTLVRLHATDAKIHPYLAKNSSTPATLLVSLSGNRQMHSALASNPRLHASLQDVLAASPSARVARALARNTAATPEILVRLSRSQDAWTQFLVATHTSSPDEALQVLADEATSWRARFAARRLLDDKAEDIHAKSPSQQHAEDLELLKTLKFFGND